MTEQTTAAATAAAEQLFAAATAPDTDTPPPLTDLAALLGTLAGPGDRGGVALALSALITRTAHDLRQHDPRHVGRAADLADTAAESVRRAVADLAAAARALADTDTAPAGPVHAHSEAALTPLSRCGRTGGRVSMHDDGVTCPACLAHLAVDRQWAARDNGTDTTTE